MQDHNLRKSENTVLRNFWYMIIVGVSGNKVAPFGDRQSAERVSLLRFSGLRSDNCHADDEGCRVSDGMSYYQSLFLPV